MKKKSTDYSGARTGGWRVRSDDIFLAQFRGLPCEICGHRGGWDDGKKQPSCGHHIIFKGSCLKHRYEKKNIVVLCPWHHSHYNKECSPHSIVSTHAQTAFEEWVQHEKPEQYAWWMEHQKDANKPFDGSWTVKDVYLELGGEIESKSGLIKDAKPVRHKAKVDALVERNKEAR